MDGVEKDSLLFELTLEELREHFKKTKDFETNLKFLNGNEDESLVDIPTLDQVFELLADSVQVNIEVKTPKVPDAKQRFNDLDVKSRTVDKMTQFLTEKSRNAIVSSFDHEFLTLLHEHEGFSSKPNRLLFIHSEMSCGKLPDAEVTNKWDLGANMVESDPHVEKSVIDRFHDNNQLCGIWFRKSEI